MDEQSRALSELRKLGLTIEIDEATAARIWGELLIIAGRVRQGYYTDPGDHWFVQNGKNDLDAYRVIAKEIVNFQTPNDVLEDVIPRAVHAFHSQQDWFPTPIGVERFKGAFLSGPIQEWKGKRFLMSSEKPSQNASPKHTIPEFPKRAEWLKARLKERAWDENDVHRQRGPDRKTVQKILRGEAVREDILEKLAKALSAKKNEVDLLDIPSD
jgi:DNA-binding Xre family transcriptional regulator